MKPHLFDSISAFLRTLDLQKPLHPLVNVIERVQLEDVIDKLPHSFLFNFYIISFKADPPGKIKYGQQYYDFEEGTMIFVAPGQVTSIEDELRNTGYSLLLHPDFLNSYPLGKTIKKFGFFSYSVNEALHLSEKEQAIIVNIFRNISDELKENIDDFTHDLIVAQIELLLTYSNRFYKRQFITRSSVVSNDLLQNFERLLNEYFDTNSALRKGLPSVQYFAKQLHYSPRYLSDMLRSLTGLAASQHIQNKIIEKAKEILSVSDLSVAETAYQLGFEHPQSFNKLFKRKTNLSPLEFRQSFS
ncbi:AraC family transcriptional regulator [Niastella yeongjuensis]|uniref:AraC family transcriptional regulator n=1 Tax=Niastella yeongjuensis TaxID=354355 RepID=A0A1V9E3V5_9BACT|nr:helix-turn-helix domain-containing protein [Niastella yeongjuensis]OQP40782.1 AraC family transcriptional regulator [Niastella yeongjuensis]SEP01868.1 Helix-turn-helix domain-containing protein [Niastella yeongjuensis]